MRNIGAIFSRELASFFNSLIAYVVLIVFLLGMGLFFWLFSDNVLFTGQASMENLFFFAPWFFLFLIPAITMRSFSEEMKSGTLEILLTKPITEWQLILGKYLASLFLVFFALLPTIIYLITLLRLGNPPNNMDMGPVMGAYLGLFSLGAIFAAIGILASTLTENQIVAFIMASFICFFFFAAFDFLADLPGLDHINSKVLRIGINEHYRSISKGVLDTRDMVYFVSFVVITLMGARLVLLNKKK